MMRKVLNSVAMDGVVVIGEGEKDEVRNPSARVWAKRGP
jgi:fructose-1,6-bisphosphatase/sedoheptulose 1,7-bisphosphatase-like protein